MLRTCPTAIEDVINTFQSQQLPNINSTTQLWILMEVLCAVPEEVSTKFLLLYAENEPPVDCPFFA